MKNVSVGYHLQLWLDKSDSAALVGQDELKVTGAEGCWWFCGWPEWSYLYLLQNLCKSCRIGLCPLQKVNNLCRNDCPRWWLHNSLQAVELPFPCLASGRARYPAGRSLWTYHGRWDYLHEGSQLSKRLWSGNYYQIVGKQVECKKQDVLNKAETIQWKVESSVFLLRCWLKGFAWDLVTLKRKGSGLTSHEWSRIGKEEGMTGSSMAVVLSCEKVIWKEKVLHYGSCPVKFKYERKGDCEGGLGRKKLPLDRPWWQSCYCKRSREKTSRPLGQLSSDKEVRTNAWPRKLERRVLPL